MKPRIDLPGARRATVTRTSLSDKRFQSKGWPGRKPIWRRMAEGMDTCPRSVKVVKISAMPNIYHVAASCQAAAVAGGNVRVYQTFC